MKCWHLLYRIGSCFPLTNLLNLQDIQETVLRLVRTADQLLRRTHLDAEGVRQRLQAVDEESENFMIKLDTRRKNISMAMSFFGLAETVCNFFTIHFSKFHCDKIEK